MIFLPEGAKAASLQPPGARLRGWTGEAQAVVARGCAQTSSLPFVKQLALLVPESFHEAERNRQISQGGNLLHDDATDSPFTNLLGSLSEVWLTTGTAPTLPTVAKLTLLYLHSYALTRPV
eukprot:GHVT01087366.1.p1 GENE.GHVT01087366.1~~GHVT01087366.1.p1  ORF type:complete len:121 (-),score=18.38 GHVT01087366.1:81-443(-)